MKAVEEIEAFLFCAVRLLCDQPQAVDVKISAQTEKLVSFIISCDPSDIAKIIGTKGKNITAIRAISEAIASKNRVKTVLLIDE